MRISILFLFLSVILWQSCSLLDLRGDTPSYIIVDELAFSHKEGQGPTNHNINYVEVYFENIPLGFYEVPFKLAVIPTMETSKLTILPAIQENISPTAITSYPMMKPFVLEQHFEENKEYELSPTFTYSEGTKFVFTETFESNHIFTTDLDTFSTTLEITSDMVSVGQGAGVMRVKEDEKMRVTTLFSNKDLANGGQVFVEVEFKGTAIFNVGLIGNTGPDIQFEQGVFLNAREDWKKVYLNMTLPVIKLKKEEVRLYLEAISSEGEGEVYLDNIKLIYN